MRKARNRMRQYDTQSFGWRVMTKRKSLGLTQAQVVERLKQHGIEMSIPALSQLELGETQRVSVAFVKALSSALQVDVACLFDAWEEPEHAA